MKRILFVCCLITATCAGTYQKAAAQTSTTVSSSDFTAKVNQLDTYIAANDTANSRITWNQVHTMMLSELAATKATIASATSETDKSARMSVMNNQIAIYRQIWTLKTNLATNRAAIHTQLGNFVATF